MDMTDWLLVIIINYKETVILITNGDSFSFKQ